MPPPQLELLLPKVLMMAQELEWEALVEAEQLQRERERVDSAATASVWKSRARMSVLLWPQQEEALLVAAAALLNSASAAAARRREAWAPWIRSALQQKRELSVEPVAVAEQQEPPPALWFRSRRQERQQEEEAPLSESCRMRR